MYNSDTDLLFPPRVIPALREERGDKWRELVSQVVPAEEGSIEKLAFILMMARINNCTACNADSFRAMHGCTACAKQSLRRFRGSDEELNQLFLKSKMEVDQYIKKI